MPMRRPGPLFWEGPLRYFRWASRERPGIFWSVIIGSSGPVILFTVPRLRRRLGYEDAPPIPKTYPIPTGPRKQLSGYDD